MFLKLVKQDIRATARLMLPVYAAVVVLAVLANISIRMLLTGTWVPCSPSSSG